MTALADHARERLALIALAALLAIAPTSCGATSAKEVGQSRMPARLGASAKGSAAISHGGVRQPLLEILATLRRPQTKADLDDPGLRRQLAFMSRHPAVAGRPVIQLVRLATVAPWGEKVFLVPSMLLSPQEAAELPADQRAIATRRRSEGLTLSAPATGGATPGQIKAGRDWGTERSDQLVIVIPDGVARVTIWPGRTVTDTQPSPVTAIVHNNIAAFESRQNLDEPQREVWYGPSGSIIKRIEHPTCPRSCG